jgi:hypothetical protein
VKKVLTMSLTSELKDAESPLSAFMAAQFPQVKELSAALRAVRPDDAEALHPPVAAGTRVAWGTLNAAIDHRLRYAFSDGRALPETVERGIAWSFRIAAPGTGPAFRRAGDDLGLLLGELIAAEQPASRSLPLVLPMAAEARFARLCYAMAWFEEVYRTGRLWPGTPLGDAGPGFTVKDLLAAVPADAVEDLVAQTEIASGALHKPRAACPPAQVHAGPDFAGSPDVGGADADLIVGGLLIDIKGTAAPSRLRKPEFYQLLGYVLLDYDDEYRIDRLGFYLSRFGRLITWPLEEYLALLGSSRSLPMLRAACATALAVRR